MAALGGRDVVGVESVGDRGQAVAGCSLAGDPLDRVGGHRRRSAEPDALCAFARERCVNESPPLYPVADGHTSACHFWSDVRLERKVVASGG